MASDDYSAQVDEQEINSHDKEPLDLLVDDEIDTGVSISKNETPEEDNESFFMRHILEIQYGSEKESPHEEEFIF